MDELVGVGGDLTPDTLIAAYSQGLFPMPVPDDVRDQIGERAPIGWWLPEMRGIIPLDGLHVSRSLRRSMKHYTVRVDTAFEEVMRRCGDPARPHGWINEDFIAAYTRLHQLGHAHSVETWSLDGKELCGGLYGVSIGGLFAGESMFHERTDASKVALVWLVDLLRRADYQLLDVQWNTEHLALLGAIEILRNEYLERLGKAVDAVTKPIELKLLADTFEVGSGSAPAHLFYRAE